MHKLLIIIALMSAFILGGCGRPQGNILLNVDFEQEKTLTYRFVTNREVILNLKGDDAGARSADKEQKTVEGIEMVVAYTPVETDTYGNITVRAECKSIKANRQTVTRRDDGAEDPVTNLQGKSWQFVINPAGEIQDYSDMERIAKELGAKAITESGQRRIKDPDLIWDFVATQWFMWDAIASNKYPWYGVNPGDSWESILPVPFGVRVPVERYVDYLVPEEQDPDSDIVTIKSNYRLRSYDEKNGRLIFTSKLSQMPAPYEGNYQTRGMFGFLKDYKADVLEGGGKAVYDIATGNLISDNQQYSMDMTAAFLFPLGDTKPALKVHQNINVELIEQGN